MNNVLKALLLLVLAASTTAHNYATRKGVFPLKSNSAGEALTQLIHNLTFAIPNIAIPPVDVPLLGKTNVSLFGPMDKSSKIGQTRSGCWFS